MISLSLTNPIKNPMAAAALYIRFVQLLQRKPRRATATTIIFQLTFFSFSSLVSPLCLYEGLLAIQPKDAHHLYIVFFFCSTECPAIRFVRDHQKEKEKNEALVTLNTSGE